VLARESPKRPGMQYMPMPYSDESGRSKLTNFESRDVADDAAERPLARSVARAAQRSAAK